MRALALHGPLAIDAAIERPGGPLAIGDTVVGRILAHQPAMAGAFVALPRPGEEGFLPDTATAARLPEGSHARFRVTRGAQGGKGPRLATLPATPEDGPTEGPVRLIARGPGAIERLATLHPGACIRVDRPGLAATLPQALRARTSLGLGDEAERAADCWAALEESTIMLAGGARFTITPTPALIAIDVDAGSATGERLSKKEAQLALNRRIIPAIARHIRLRNLSGAILVDPAGLPQRLRPQLAEVFRAALAEDPLAPRFLGFSALGLAEIERRRTAPPLHDLLRGPHAEALAGLAALACATEERPGAAPALALAPDLLGALEADEVARAEFRERTGRMPTLLAEPSLAAQSPHWRLVS